jgi:hypothetical protein
VSFVGVTSLPPTLILYAVSKAYPESPTKGAEGDKVAGWLAINSSGTETTSMTFMNVSDLPIGAKVNVKLLEVTLIRYSLNKYREFFAYQLCNHLSTH